MNSRVCSVSNGFPSVHDASFHNAPVTLCLDLAKYPLDGRPPVSTRAVAHRFECPRDRVEGMVAGVAGTAEMAVTVGAEEDKV